MAELSWDNLEDCPEERGNLFRIKSRDACIGDVTVEVGALVIVSPGAGLVVVDAVVIKGLVRSCITLEGATKSWWDMLTWGRVGKF